MGGFGVVEIEANSFKEAIEIFDKQMTKYFCLKVIISMVALKG